MNKQILVLICLNIVCIFTACTNSAISKSESMVTEKTEISSFNTNNDISKETENTVAESSVDSDTTLDVDFNFKPTETSTINTESQGSGYTTVVDGHRVYHSGTIYVEHQTETTTEYIPPKPVEVKTEQDVGFWWSELEIRPICNEIADAFIDKDYDKIKSFLCEKTLLEHDVDAELTNAFNLIDWDNIKHDEDVALPQSGGHSMNDDRIVSSYTCNTILGLRTDAGKKYKIVFILVSMSDDASRIGVQRITIREIQDSLSENPLICSIGEDYTS